LTFAIGVFFTGPFLVALPVILRDEFGASIARISTLQLCFWGGTILATFAIGAAGPLPRKGLLIAWAIASGTVTLALMAFPMPLLVFYGLTFIWGLGAGVFLTAARTIVQEDAPADTRARVMSVYQLGFTGGMPAGALLCGPFIELLGGRGTALAAAIAMACALVATVLWTRLLAIGARQAATP
jgi:predicted MFS family arabinose efflux permease